MPDPAVTDRAVILARGLGTRMRRAAPEVSLNERQAEIADTGVKALIPIERPFLDYVLASLADAGYRRICLVIGPEHDVMREYYGQTLRPRRLEIDFAIQAEPLGTADAVAAAKQFADSEDFVVLNSDNYYPVESLAALRTLETPGLPGFQRDGLLSGSNIPPERIFKFAVIQVDPDGFLQRIVEKPDPQTLATFPEPICVSMNVFRFSPAIFEACARIEPSARGELELPDAVRYAMDRLGQRFRVVPFNAPVLDLSSRADVAPVARELADVEVDL